MKKVVLFFLFSLFMEGVNGEFVSVMQGDSVTLHTALTEILNNYVIDWRFGPGDLIARIRKDSDPSVEENVLNGTFKGRLKVDHQTGDLTITNIKTTDSGDYKVINKQTTIKKFSLSVVLVEEVKSVSVLDGDSVTLNSDSTDIQRYDLIRWRFKHQNSLIAEINRKARNISKYDGPDGIFKHRLQLDYFTGSLTIKHIGTSHSGLYEVNSSSSSRHTIQKKFNVTVSGEMRTVLVMKGDSVTLHTEVTEVYSYDFILWMFGETVLTENYKTDKEISYNDERFRGRLMLDSQTGSLTITDIRTTDTGLYEVKISSNRHTIHKRNIITVIGEIRTVPVKEGDPITLYTDVTEIHTDDQIVWMFGYVQIAEIKNTDQRFHTYDDADGRFRDRLKLDHQTGSLTITNTKTTDSGCYQLKINGSRHTIHKRNSVTVIATGLSTAVAGICVAGVVVILLVTAAVLAVIHYRRKISILKKLNFVAISLTEGKSGIIDSNIPDIWRHEILWMFGGQETPIAKINEKPREITIYNDALNGRFRGSLMLDEQTGSLKITKVAMKHAGRYKLQIIKSEKASSRIFIATVTDGTSLETNSYEEEHFLASVDTSSS